MAEEVVRTVVFDLNSELRECFEEIKNLIRETKAEADARTRIAAVAEMRRLIATAGRVAQIMTGAQANAEFQAEVLDALADRDVALRREIMGIFEKRAIDQPEQAEKESKILRIG